MHENTGPVLNEQEIQILKARDFFAIFLKRNMNSPVTTITDALKSVDTKRNLESETLIAAFPLMKQLDDGTLNKHPDLTSLKPVADRHENELHPSQILDLNQAENYYTYSWMVQDADSVSVANYTAFGSLLLLIAVIVYILTGTKLVKFVQFFITRKDYSNLEIVVSRSGPTADDHEAREAAPQRLLNAHAAAAICETSNTLGNNQNDAGSHRNLLLAVGNEHQMNEHLVRTSGGLCTGLAYHASELMQFYTPGFLVHKLLSCKDKSNLALPKYVMISQIILRAVLIVALTVTAAFIYLTFALNDYERNCVLSRDMKNTSYHCLNESPDESVIDDHRDSVYVIGVNCALLSTIAMYVVSSSVFSNFISYLDKLFENEVQIETQTPAFSMQPIDVPSSETVKQTSPKKIRKSPCKRKYDSVSSFRALLANDSDGSMIALNNMDTGYDSSSGAQTSMSTQANNLLGFSERASSFQAGLSMTNASHALNISSQSSARITAASATQSSDVVAKPRCYQAAANNAVADLLPIDEDVDDEKCSPIKPKKRTQEDSPFKRNNLLAKASGGQPGQLQIAAIGNDDDIILRKSPKQLNVAQGDADRRGTEEVDNIAMGGLEISVKDQSAAEMSFGGFQLAVERVEGHQPDTSGSQDHFEGLRTLNSGRTQTHGELDAIGSNRKTGVTTRNHPSINANSYSGVEDSTLQLDTIAGVRPQAASSSKNHHQNHGKNNPAEERPTTTPLTINHSIAKLGSAMPLSHSSESHSRQTQSLGGPRNEQNSSSYIVTQQNEDEQQPQPQSVRYSRPVSHHLKLGLMDRLVEPNQSQRDHFRHVYHTGKDLSERQAEMTPLALFQDNHVGASHEVQTEDKNSINLPFARHGEMLSSDQISKLSNSQRPESAQRLRKPRRAPSNQLPPGFEIETKEGADGAVEGKKVGWSRFKALVAISLTISFIFSICMSVYLLYSLPEQALKFTLIGLAVASICDLFLQLALLTLISSRQLYHDLRSQKLPLDTVKLRQMTATASALATHVFSRYREESALLQVGFQDEIDIMLDKLERDIEKQSDSNSEDSQRGGKLVGPKDTLVKDATQSIRIDGFTIQISQKLKLRPPKNQSRHSSSKLNIVQPGIESSKDGKSGKLAVVSQNLANVASDRQQHPSISIDNASDSSSSKRRFQRRMIRQDVSAYERTQQFFADQKPKARNGNVSTPLKRSATMLRQSIDNIELEKLESDFSRPQSKEQIQQQRDSNDLMKSQTPDRLRQHGRSSLVGQSSNQKASQFETPKAQVSQVKLKQGGSVVNDEQNLGAKSDIRSEKQSEVRRKLILKRSSNQTFEGSKDENKSATGKLSAVKNYLEDAIGDTQDLAGMILNNSSQSIVGGAGIENMDERYTSQDKAFLNHQYASFDCRDPTTVNQSRDQEVVPGQETYSPMFSSVNRKPGNPKIDAVGNVERNLSKEVGSILSQKNLASKLPAKNQSSQPMMSKPGNDETNRSNSMIPADLIEKSASQESSNKSKLMHAILSHKEALSKQQSFNSPTSLQERLQMTNEKIKNSLQGSSLHKGRRKMVMLDEAGVSKQSLNFGPQNIGTALLNSSAQRIPFLHQNSINDSSGAHMTPIRQFDSYGNILPPTQTYSQDMIDKVQQAPPKTAPGRVLFQDQGHRDYDNSRSATPLELDAQQHDGDDDEDLFMNYAAEVAQVTANAPKDLSQEGIQDHYYNDDVGEDGGHSHGIKGLARGHDQTTSEFDPSSSIFNSQAKRLSLQSNQAQSAKTGNEAAEQSTVYKNNMQAQPATETKTSQKTSAFQRLVMASKRMMQKKSSEKKDGGGFKSRRANSSNNTAAGANQIRSASDCTDTINLMKDQANNQMVAENNKAIFAQPFRVGSRKQQHRSSTRNNERTANTAPANTAQASTEPANAAPCSAGTKDQGQKPAAQTKATGDAKHQVKPTKHTITSLQVLAQNSLESTFKLPDEKCERISEILEHESMEVDTPLQPMRAQDGVIQKDPNNSGVFIVPAQFNKEQVNPVKNYANSALLDVPIDPQTDANRKPNKQKLKQQQNGGSSRDRFSSQDPGNYSQSNRGSQEQKSKPPNRGFKQRKNSQLTQKEDNSKGSKMARRNSKNSNNVPKAGGTQEKRKLKTHSSRENTVSSMSIDFDKMDKQRDEDYSDYSKMISAGSTLSRLEDQRRRLESFLSLAQQAKSKRDIHKIQDMIKQIDETQKPLPMTRINELKLLELMASPYNQSLIAMIKVELDISRKLKEFKKANQSNQRLTKSKFTLPKHLTNQNSQCFVEEVLQNDDSKNTFDKKYEITRPAQPEAMQGGNGVLSDNRLTTVVNIRPQGIQSCRSNNDVAPPKTFNRSPSHRNQSPLSVGVCQQVFSGKRPLDKKAGENHSVLESGSQSGGRYSYLRSVGNAVVQSKDDVRNSVDRINLPSAGSHLQQFEGMNHLSVNAAATAKPDRLVESLKQSRIEAAEGRRGTAPNFGDDEQGRHQIRAEFLKPDFTGANLSGGPQSPSEMSSAQNFVQADVQKRSTTSYGIQQIGPMMHGREGFVKRINPLQSKSALAQNKENQIQPKAKK